MKKPIKIGEREFKLKKDALQHYKTILNSYEFGQSLNDSDYNDLLDLLDYDYFNHLVETESSDETYDPEISNKSDQTNLEVDNNIEIQIIDIKVSKVQFSTKCFEIFFSDNTSQYISYLMILNKKKYSPEGLFTIACRNSIHNDVRSVKQDFFDRYSEKGKVKCQETNQLSSWTELVVDHRQPNTFSIIVDRFKEISKIDLNLIDYTSNDQNHIVFKDEKLENDFRMYHREKANLRLVRKECNSSRTGMARVKSSSKDLSISNK